MAFSGRNNWYGHLNYDLTFLSKYLSGQSAFIAIVDVMLIRRKPESKLMGLKLADF
jgi:hypothetical protein